MSEILFCISAFTSEDKLNVWKYYFAFTSEDTLNVRKYYFAFTSEDN